MGGGGIGTRGERERENSTEQEQGREGTRVGPVQRWCVKGSLEDTYMNGLVEHAPHS